MNKFELMNVVTTSTLAADDKTLLIELIIRMDEEGLCWPSVERLCKVRGIKHEKNFKGVDVYLPGLVTKGKRGRKNYYTLNIPAISELEQFEVNIKHTPARTANTPSTADNTPAVADNTPSVAGANSTLNTTVNTTTNNTMVGAVADAPLPPQEPASLRSLSLVSNKDSKKQGEGPKTDLLNTNKDTPSRAGVLDLEAMKAARETLEAEQREFARNYTPKPSLVSAGGDDEW